MSDAASPKVKKATKPKKPAEHPKYADMIAAAIASLKDRTGSSRQAILKYVIANYKVDAAKAGTHVRMALKAGITKGSLKFAKESGKGAGCYKLAEKPKKEKKEKKPAAKKPEKKTAAKKSEKKTVAKKATDKKPAAKKPAPKKAKATKKPTEEKKKAAPKPKATKKPAAIKQPAAKTKKPAAKKAKPAKKA